MCAFRRDLDCVFVHISVEGKISAVFSCLRSLLACNEGPSTQSGFKSMNLGMTCFCVIVVEEPVESAYAKSPILEYAEEIQCVLLEGRDRSSDRG